MPETLLLAKDESVATITIHRPKALNALNTIVMREIHQALDDFESDPDIRVIILTGSERAFAAGADIAEMRDKEMRAVFAQDFLSGWERIARCRKPIIAAVAGFALGGGCEIALMCDFIIAADNAQFGQPEIRLGVIPGMGGSQRLTRAVGKAKAMDMILTGRRMGAIEAEQAGLVARIVPAAELLVSAKACALEIAGFSGLTALAAKEAVNAVFETSLHQGLMVERRLFHMLFGTPDQKEGMAAFLEKRTPGFNAPDN